MPVVLGRNLRAVSFTPPSPQKPQDYPPCNVVLVVVVILINV
jgi:hypothetical protein